jgi:hypothetical protein
LTPDIGPLERELYLALLTTVDDRASQDDADDRRTPEWFERESRFIPRSEWEPLTLCEYWEQREDEKARDDK